MSANRTVNGTVNGAPNGDANGNPADLGPVPSLPTPNLKEISAGVSLLEPLSRKGYGPGLVILVPAVPNEVPEDKVAIKEGVPSALIKWAEEGYTVVELREQAFGNSKDALKDAIAALQQCEKYEPASGIGLVAYDTKLWNQISPLIEKNTEIVATVVYSSTTETNISTSTTPSLQHLSGKSKTRLPRSKALTAYDYTSTKSHLFATPFSPEFNYASESMSHTRNLQFLKPLMNSPYFDLEAIWDEHTYFEFDARSAPHTMSTMVQEPYVNHIPTLTGGTTRPNLTNFYTHHFIHANPPDTVLEPISRTLGIDRIVDEFIFKCTHTCAIDWLIPGIPPTGKELEIAFTAIVNVRGDRLYHEHISWDQASVLRQLGLLEEWGRWPYEVKDGKGRSWEYRLPVAGWECAAKMREKNAVESNGLFGYELREVKE